MAGKGKGKMKLNAWLAQVCKYEKAFQAIVTIAYREGRTFEWMLERRTEEVFEHPNWKRLPSCGQSDFCRYSSGALQALEATVVRWQLYLDGKPVASSEVPQGRWCDVKGRHEWAHKPGQPYYSSKEHK